MRVQALALAAAGVAVAALLTACSGSSDAGGSSSAAAQNGVAAKCASSGLGATSDQTYCGFGLNPPQPRPQFTMTDTSGQVVKFANLTGGKPTLLFFGYTTCPDVCPTTMADISQALRDSPASTRAAVQVAFVSTDPATDTAPVITAWLSKFGFDPSTKVIGLRGPDAQVHAAEVAAHVMVSEDEGKTHSAQVLLYGADDYAPVAFAQTDDEAADMTHDLAVVLKGK